MTEHDLHISALITGYLRNELTEVQSNELVEWVNSSKKNARIFSEINDPGSLAGDLEKMYSYDRERVSAQIEVGIQKWGTGLKTSFDRAYPDKHNWFRYAAILLLIAGTAAILYNYSPRQASVQLPVQNAADIRPGGNRAVLTLSDGTKIPLDSTGSGHLATQGNTEILKLDGALAYRSQNSQEGHVMYNTISTPKGGQYQIILPDGTKVWLNAASSIRFPTTFGKERSVEITGESYLEIAADKTSPFSVKTGNTIIQVLGTAFNVNAYTDEPFIKTTLLEGSIQIISGQAETRITPGEQLSLAAGNRPIVTKNTDLAAVLAWKNGLFNFSNVSFEQSMRQIAKWYNVEVVYEKNIPAITLEGEMKRNLNFDEMLNFLHLMGVNCRLDAGRRLIILPSQNT